ncbi:antitoxin VbhA family protein [Priestia megaterium]|uniref:antitoxin VbhA family protein n=1 Tax=Priestia megaterium TaxID=1404 RepID=UPI002FFEDDC5
MKNNKKDIKKAIENTKASFAVEGHYLSSEEEELIRKKVNGELSDKEFLHEVKKLNELE